MRRIIMGLINGFEFIGTGLNKIVEEQAEQKEIMDAIAAPYTAAELCEIIDETEEILMRNNK
jgi:hypothetical protein